MVDEGQVILEAGSWGESGSSPPSVTPQGLLNTLRPPLPSQPCQKEG